MPVSTLQVKDEINRVTKMAAQLERCVEDMERVQMPAQVAQTVARACLDELRPIIRGMILANYASSGVHSRTGKLRDAIGSCIIGGSFDLGKPWKLWVLLPGNVSPYVYTPHPLPGHQPGKRTSSSFYQVAMTLTYGGVIPEKKGTYNTLNKKSRRSLKERAIDTGKTGGKRGGVAYRVIRPMHVFWLSPGQKAELSAMFTQKFTQKMRDFINGSR